MDISNHRYEVYLFYDNEFDTLIQELVPNLTGFSIVVEEKMSNDTAKVFNCDNPVLEENIYELPFFGSYRTSIILDQLALEEKIPKGIYVIRASW